MSRGDRLNRVSEFCCKEILSIIPQHCFFSLFPFKTLTCFRQKWPWLLSKQKWFQWSKEKRQAGAVLLAFIWGHFRPSCIIVTHSEHVRICVCLYFVYKIPSFFVPQWGYHTRLCAPRFYPPWSGQGRPSIHTGIRKFTRDFSLMACQVLNSRFKALYLTLIDRNG